MNSRFAHVTIFALSALTALALSEIVLDADRVRTDTLHLNTIKSNPLDGPDTNLVEAFTMTFNSYFLHSTPVLDSGQQYSMTISGRYHFASIRNGLDAAYYYCYYSCSACNFNTSCDTAFVDTRITNNLRPDVDVYVDSHVYQYTFMGADTAMVFEFFDGGGYGDNGGSLDITISKETDDYEYIRADSTSVYFTEYETGVIMKSPNGNCWRLHVNNGGSVSALSVGCPD